MKAFFAALQRSPKLAALSAILVGAVIVPASLMAWGPDRPTYTIENPANQVVFNSITNNPAYGDERNFVRIKEATASSSTYSDNIALQAGKEYEVYVYFHNNAKTSLNASGVGVAKDAKLRMEVPSVVKAGQTGAINGYISASNANPGTVWDEARATTANGDVALRYVPESAVISSFGAVNGQKLPNSLFTSGAALGYDALNGILPGCEQFAGYVKFRLAAVQPNFDVQKQVSLAGKNAYSESVTVKHGDVVDYKIQYTNTGTVQQNNVIIKDALPAGMSYVPGSTFMSNSKTGGKWEKVNSDEITKGGINAGNYQPNGGNVYVKFSAKVDDKSLTCGTKTLVNTASANTSNGSKSDTANVVLTKECQPGETPVVELPQTGVDGGVLAAVGLGFAAAGAAYAATSTRVRNLLRR